MSAYSTMRNNAKRRGLAFDLTPSEVKYYRSLTKCQATGCTLNINEPSADNPKRLTIDRINNNFGYVRGNIATVCWAVNTRKGVFEAKGCKPRFTYKYITNDGWYFKYKHGKNTWMKID